MEDLQIAPARDLGFEPISSQELYNLLDQTAHSSPVSQNRSGARTEKAVDLFVSLLISQQLLLLLLLLLSGVSKMASCHSKFPQSDPRKT